MEDYATRKVCENGMAILVNREKEIASRAEGYPRDISTMRCRKSI